MNRKTFAIDLLLLTAIWIASLIIINPTGDFPLMDDWSYGITVKNLVEDTEYKPTDWSVMSLITQVFWGSIFCIPFGFSFEAIRLSTIVLSMFGIFGLYFLLRNLNQPRWFTIFVSLTLAYSPIYFALSSTFMTDVPFTSLIIITSFFYIQYLKKVLNYYLVIALILSVAATLLRQIGVALPLAFGILFILKNGFSKKHLIRALFPFCVTIISLLLFEQWLNASGRMPSIYGKHAYEVLRAFTFIKTIPTLLENAFVSLMYLGWFLFPILLILLGQISSKYRKNFLRTFIISSSLIFVGAIIMALQDKLLMPSLQNIIIRSGIGPLTLADTTYHNYSIVELPKEFWILITGVSLSGAILLLTFISLSVIRIANKIRLKTLDSLETSATFLILGGMIYLFPFLISGFIFFDRYLLPVIPLFLVAIVYIHANFRQTPGRFKHYLIPILLLILLAIFSIAGTKDYFSWNRARWKSLTVLLNEYKVRPEEIDGGFEFNGLYLFNADYEPSPEKSNWWVDDNKYIISFSQLPNYETYRIYSYNRVLPPKQEKIYVLRRNENPDP